MVILFSSTQLADDARRPLLASSEPAELPWCGGRGLQCTAESPSFRIVPVGESVPRKVCWCLHDSNTATSSYIMIAIYNTT